jgi:nucleoid-associated protein YgaU
MGLFNFLKTAGAKIFKNRKPETEQETEEEKSVHAKHLFDHITSMGLDTSKVLLYVTGDKVTLKGEAATQEQKEKILLTAGNVEGVGSVEDELTVAVPAPEARFVTVESGDTLSRIAKEQYGNANDYMKIFEANKPMLKSPDLIYPGQVLRIP